MRFKVSFPLFVDLNLCLPKVSSCYLPVLSHKANLHLQVRFEVALYELSVLSGSLPDVVLDGTE